MADEGREDDEWLYGRGDADSKSSVRGDRVTSEGDESSLPTDPEKEGLGKEDESSSVVRDEEEQSGQGANTTANGGSEDDEEEDSDDDDDDGVQVVIGDVKSAAGQSPFGSTVVGVKRPAPAPDKKGKFSVEDFDTPGNINGVSALEFNIDGLEDKPWRKPGADITDYFNYGFTEETWRAYTDRQKRMRFESGGPQIINPIGPKPENRGVISVAFGGQGQMQNQRVEMIARRREDSSRENTIQVMTADRREYSRKNFEMGMGGPLGVPPPFNPSIPPPNFPPPGHGAGPDFMPNPEYFNHPPPQYYPDEHQGYEEQWMDHHSESWDMGGPPPGASSSIVSLTKVANVPPPPGDEDIKHERKD